MVMVENSTAPTITYDYVVIASGSTTPATTGLESALVPFKSTNSLDLRCKIREAQEVSEGAKSIIIGGAGAVGVEFAREVAEAFQDKDDGLASITLVSATKNLLPTLKEGAGMAAARLLETKGVKLLVSRKVEKAEQDHESKQWTVTPDGGERLVTDLYISTTGVIPQQ